MWTVLYVSKTSVVLRQFVQSSQSVRNDAASVRNMEKGDGEGEKQVPQGKQHNTHKDH